MNKFQEKCFKCSKWILPNEGEFVQYSTGWKVLHPSCKSIAVAVVVGENTNKKYLEYLFENKSYFYFLISQKVHRALATSDRRKYFFQVPDIFLDSVDVFTEKYIEGVREVKDEKHAKYIMRKILHFQVYQFIQKTIDRNWYAKLTPSQKKSNLKPPSYFYHKKYLELNKERINERRRANYQTNPKLKIQRKAKNERNKKVQEPPISIEHLRSVWKKSTYVKRQR